MAPSGSEPSKTRRFAVVVAEGVVLAVVVLALLLAAWQTLLMVLACSGVGYATGWWLCRSEGDE